MVNPFDRAFRHHLVSPSAQVSAPYADMVEGFVLVGNQTTMPHSELVDIAKQWASGQYDKRRNNTTQVAKLLTGLAWEWPAFDSMMNRLLHDNRWPAPWHRYEAKIKEGEGLDNVRAKIFIQTARGASDTIRASKNKTFTTMLSLEGWHLYTDSEVGAHYVKMFSGAVNPKDWRTWPPLYPGDQSRMARGLEGVRSRRGKFYGLDGDKPFWAS